MRIKAGTLLVTLLSIVAADAAAQKSLITMGGRLGATYSSFAIDPEPDGVNTEFTLGFAIGGEMNFWLNEQFAIAPQLIYNQKGSRHEFNFGGGLFSSISDITVSYLELPIYAKLQLGDDRVRPYIFGGPAIAVLLAANEKQTSNGKTDNRSIKDDFPGLDININAGAGMSVELNSGFELVMDAAYCFGLTDLAEDDQPGGGSVKAFHRSVRVMGGLLLRF
jgi:hypothetical protein